MGKRLISRAQGFVHDIEQVRVLSDEPCHMRLLSDKALYVLQNLANKDVSFLARYGEIVGDGQYIPVEIGTPDEGEVIAVRDIIREQLMPICTDVFDRIAASLESMASRSPDDCGCTVGEGPEAQNGIEGGSPPPPVGGVVYTDPDPGIVNRKCKVANALWEAMRGLIAEFIRVNVLNTIVYGLTFVIAVIIASVGLVVAAVLGRLLTATAGSIANFAGRLMAGGVDLQALLTALDVRRDDIICAMFNAVTSSEAKDNVLAILGEEALNQSTISAFDVLVNNTFLNVLFYDVDGLAAHLDGQQIFYDCSLCPAACVLYQALFPVNGGGGPITSIDGNVITLESSDVNTVDGNHRAGLVVNYLADQSAQCGSDVFLEVTSVVGGNFLAGVGFQVWDDGMQVYGNDVPWIGQLCGEFCVFVSSTPFTIEVTVGDDC